MAEITWGSSNTTYTQLTTPGSTGASHMWLPSSVSYTPSTSLSGVRTSPLTPSSTLTLAGNAATSEYESQGSIYLPPEWRCKRRRREGYICSQSAVTFVYSLYRKQQMEQRICLLMYHVCVWGGSWHKRRGGDSLYSKANTVTSCTWTGEDTALIECHAHSLLIIKLQSIKTNIVGVSPGGQQLQLVHNCTQSRNNRRKRRERRGERSLMLPYFNCLVPRPQPQLNQIKADAGLPGVQEQYNIQHIMIWGSNHDGIQPRPQSNSYCLQNKSWCRSGNMVRSTRIIITCWWDTAPGQCVGWSQSAAVRVQ